MRRVILIAVVSIALGFGAGWAARGHHGQAQPEDGDAIAGLVMGAYDGAITAKYPKQAPAPDHLNVALTVCDSRKAMAPGNPALSSRDNCAARTLGWENYFTEAVNASRHGRKSFPPPAGE